MQIQSAFANGVAVGLPGMVANEEKCNKISRTVENAAGIGFGQPAFRGAGDHGVVAGGTFSGASVSSTDAGNLGSGTITATPAINAPAKAGRYMVVMVATGVSGAFNLYDPDGLIVDDGVAGAAKTAGGIGPFTIGGTPTATDRFYIDVTYAANSKFLGIAVMNPAVPVDAGTPDRYPQYWTGAFMVMGAIWVVAGGNVVPGASVYWDPATLRYVSDTTKIKVGNYRFDSTAANGDMVRIVDRLRDA